MESQFGGLHETARSIYGRDAAGYEAGRPPYPAVVYETLRTRCGLAAGTAVLEVGPGTGQVTRELLAAGATVTAVEPDAELAAYLRARHPEVSVVASTLEAATLPAAAYDLAVAATAFHWVDQTAGLAALRSAVRPGGAVALWWTIFEDPARPDPFYAASRPLRGEAPDADTRAARAAFQLDARARLADLTAAGFTAATATEIRTTVRLDATGVRALHASFIGVRRLPEEARERVLDGLEAVVRNEFGGAVDRPFVTPLYTAHVPALDA